DSAAFSFTLGAVSGGYFQLASAPGSPVTSFTSAELAAGQVQFVDDGDEVAPGFSVRVNDGAADSNTLAAAITYTSANDAPDGVPAIAGTATEDQVLTADTSGISDAEGLGAFSYQWLRDGAPITGAGASIYVLDDADVGKQIRVQVSYIDGQGSAESLASAPTAAVANLNDAPSSADFTVAADGTEQYVFRLADFAFLDADGDALSKIRVTALPARGTLTLNGAEVAANQDVAAADIAAGHLRLVQGPPQAQGADTATFRFQVHDGTTYSAAVNTGNVEVAAAAAPVEQPVGPPLVPAQQPATPPAAAPAAPTAAPQPGPAVREASPAVSQAAADPVAASQDEPAAPQPGFALKPPVLAIATAAPDISVQERPGVPAVRLEGISFVPVAFDAAALPVLAPAPALPHAEAAGRALAATRSQTFVESLDRMREQVAETAVLEQRVAGATFAAGTGISVGFVIWLLRGGALLTSVLSSLPAWRFVDPLPVLARLKDERDEGDDGESLESLVGSGSQAPPEPAVAQAPYRGECEA
ncbi:MAG: hypothetical protein IT514_14360, partial [Burkholderiales bacterium]|nr:hypothetical protein [Burkholderiales bacterium]